MSSLNSGLSDAQFRKSTKSEQASSCVEVALNLPGIAAVRDTKDRDGGTIVVSSAQWRRFISAAKTGAHDL